jgi:phosphatidylserine/phosphatidylglycerophosphate/cardiolipin synthase-like enzyme
MAKTAVLDTKYQFFTTTEYWQALLRRIEQTKTGDRIALMAMDFVPNGPLVQAALAATLQAVERGVHVWLLIDAHSPWLEIQRQTLATISAKENGHALVIHSPRRSLKSPYGGAGRSHIKCMLVNNEVFIGGCNLNNEHFIDLMVARTDPALAEYLFAFIANVYRSGHVGRSLHWKDQRLELDSTTSLLIDAGKPKQSGILAQALELIDDAKESITFAGQFFPNSVTGGHLAAAHKRGVAVHIIFADPGTHHRIVRLSQNYSVWREKLRLAPELFREARPRGEALLHAKLLVTDKGSIVGSHNLVRAGVVLGTAEIALVSRDPVFGQAALATLKGELPTTPS